MYTQTPSNDICHQIFTQFKSGLPLIPLLSPLILGYPPYTPDSAQRHQRQLEYSGTPPSNSNGGALSDTAAREQRADGTPSHNGTDIKDENPTIDPSRLELATEMSTREKPSREQMTTAPPNNEAGSSSSLSEPNNAVMQLPTLHDVGAFHAHACIVEVLAPAIQRGSSHRAEVIGTTQIGSEKYNVPTPSSPNPVIDSEFLSFSPFSSSYHDSALLSPSWKLELTLSSSWHLAAESAVSFSQPVGQGSSLVRRPATRRKGVAGPNSPKIPIRKSPYMNGSRTLFDLSHRRSHAESGILRAMNSPVLKSHGYRVRFQEMDTM